MNDTDKALKDQEEELRKHYEKFWKTASEEYINGNISVKEFGFILYKQGHLDQTPKGVDIDPDIFADNYQREAFIKFIEDCLENPSSTTEASQNDYVLVEYDCPGHDKCIAWPDRCEDVGGDGEKCTTLINLSKLCGVQKGKIKLIPPDKNAILTPEEVKILSDIVARYNK